MNSVVKFPKILFSMEISGKITDFKLRALRSRSLCDGSALHASIDDRCAALLRLETNHLELYMPVVY